MNCPKCSAENINSRSYCVICGASLKETPQDLSKQIPQKRFNWAVPLFLTLVFTVAVYVLAPVTGLNHLVTIKDSSSLANNLIQSLCLAAVCPGAALWLVSIILYIRKHPQPTWWPSWGIKAWVIGIAVLGGIVVVRPLILPPGSDLLYKARNDIANKYYEDAADELKLLMRQYPQSRLTSDALNLLSSIYSDWVKVLVGSGHPIQALLRARELRTVNPGSTAVADQLFQVAEASLSQDTGQDGQIYLKAQASSLCKKAGAPWTISNADLLYDPTQQVNQNTILPPLSVSEVVLPASPSEPARAVDCSGAGYPFPPQHTAVKPAQLQYVVMMIAAQDKYDTCTFGGQPVGNGMAFEPTGVLTRYQLNWTVTVIKVADGQTIATHKFLGATPGTCPEHYKFQETGATLLTEDLKSDQPPAKELVDTWLASVLP